MSTTKVNLNDGNKVSWLGFGTGTALYKQDVSDWVAQVIDNGITHLDGAQVYQNEDTLGQGIKLSGKPRSELFVTTKFYQLQHGGTVKDELLYSLKKLGLDYVDLFLIHDPTQFTKEAGKLRDVWSQLEALKDEGLTKSIGVSNFKVVDLNEILPVAKVVPAVNQIELHPYVWKAAQPIVELCHQNGIKIASYGGQIPLTRVPDGPLKDILPNIRARLEHTRGAPVTEGQVLAKWILKKGDVVITTSSKMSRVKEFLDTENVPDLTEDEIKAIDEAGSKLHKRVWMRHAFGESDE